VKYMTVQTGDAIDIAALTIDPEETKLGKIELMPEDEKEESREKQLGLVDFGPDTRSQHRGPEGDPEDFVDDQPASVAAPEEAAKADGTEEEK